MYPDDKSQKRVEKLFSGLEQITGQSIPNDGILPGDNRSSPPVVKEAPVPILDDTVSALVARVQELEAKLKLPKP